MSKKSNFLGEVLHLKNTKRKNQKIIQYQHILNSSLKENYQQGKQKDQFSQKNHQNDRSIYMQSQLDHFQEKIQIKRKSQKAQQQRNLNNSILQPIQKMDQNQVFGDQKINKKKKQKKNDPAHNIIPRIVQCLFQNSFNQSMNSQYKKIQRYLLNEIQSLQNKQPKEHTYKDHIKKLQSQLQQIQRQKNWFLFLTSIVPRRNFTGQLFHILLNLRFVARKINFQLLIQFKDQIHMNYLKKIKEIEISLQINFCQNKIKQKKELQNCNHSYNLQFDYLIRIFKNFQPFRTIIYGLKIKQYCLKSKHTFQTYLRIVQIIYEVDLNKINTRQAYECLHNKIINLQFSRVSKNKIKSIEKLLFPQKLKQSLKKSNKNKLKMQKQETEITIKIKLFIKDTQQIIPSQITQAVQRFVKVFIFRNKNLNISQQQLKNFDFNKIKQQKELIYNYTSAIILVILSKFTQQAIYKKIKTSSKQEQKEAFEKYLFFQKVIAEPLKIIFILKKYPKLQKSHSKIFLSQFEQNKQTTPQNKYETKKSFKIGQQNNDYYSEDILCQGQKNQTQQNNNQNKETSKQKLFKSFNSSQNHSTAETNPSYQKIIDLCSFKDIIKRLQFSKKNSQEKTYLNSSNRRNFIHEQYKNQYLAGKRKIQQNQQKTDQLSIQQNSEYESSESSSESEYENLTFKRSNYYASQSSKKSKSQYKRKFSNKHYRKNLQSLKKYPIVQYQIVKNKNQLLNKSIQRDSNQLPKKKLKTSKDSQKKVYNMRSQYQKQLLTNKQQGNKQISKRKYSFDIIENQKKQSEDDSYFENFSNCQEIQQYQPPQNLDNHKSSLLQSSKQIPLPQNIEYFDSDQENIFTFKINRQGKIKKQNNMSSYLFDNIDENDGLQQKPNIKIS